MPIILICALALCLLILGFLCGWTVGKNSQQKEIEKLRRRLKQLNMELQQRKTIEPTSGHHEAGCVRADEKGIRTGFSEQPTPDNKKPEIPPTDFGRTVKKSATTMDQVYQQFGQTATLKAVFNYSFPHAAYFQSGEGYIRNAKNQLLPDRQIFSQVNTATGYAIGGLLWAFDAVYLGKEYTFSQILDKQMTTGYVRVESVICSALVEPAGAEGCYRLVEKGKLNVVDA